MSTQRSFDSTFYGRWVAANALGELLGLGATGFVGWLAFGSAEGAGVAQAVATALGAAVLGAAIEGTTVGLMQAWVLRRRLPGLAAPRWAMWTALGAGVAWALGMVPGTLMNLGEADAAAPPQEPDMWQVLMLATAMGAVLGPVLGIPQWLELRRHVRRAGRWIGANALAWAVGMPVIFVGTSAIGSGMSVVAVVSVIGAACLAAGAVVGAVHGLAMERLVRDGSMESDATNASQ